MRNKSPRVPLQEGAAVRAMMALERDGGVASGMSCHGLPDCGCGCGCGGDQVAKNGIRLILTDSGLVCKV